MVSVAFFAGTNTVGFGRPVSAVPPPLPPGPVLPPILVVGPTNYWELVWTNPPPGTNIPLTAIATDQGGLATTSAPVDITVLPALPPPPLPTNLLVSILATDPIAIEGTNCWVWPGETNATPTWAAWPPVVRHYFTNCGPKTATFTVFRFGDTNGDLTVNYAIGGTASNGVDYVRLPGFVTFPAGKSRELITILPIDDGPPDINKTVILTLSPSTNVPPDYLVGHPSRAAAIIIDTPGPSPLTGLLPDSCLRLALPGPDAAWFSLECSTNLINWLVVCTNQVIHGSIDFVDPDAPGSPFKFYRAVPSGPPPE